MSIRARTALRGFVATALMLTASAAHPTAPLRPEPPVAKPVAIAAEPRRFVTDHVATIQGKPVRYRATVEEFFITDPASGQRTASIFTTSYLRTDVPKKKTVRPVLFAFNGGPGSASIWLNMGFLSPRTVDLGDPATPRTVPPFRLVDNDDTPLDVADIVLIDPAGTGFSRILPAGKPENFYGVQADAQATVAILRQWVQAYARWNAPKFLLSESYGTVRAAVVAKLMAGGPTATGSMDGMTLNGVILLGQAMQMGATGDQAILTLLPSLASTACFHHKVAADCTAEGQVAAARRFVEDRYQRALWLGSQLPAVERAAIADSLSRLIGLPKSVILAHDLRISAADFQRELLASTARQVGAYDARYVLPLAAAGGDPVADDPAMGQYVPAFVAAYADYARTDLKVTLDLPYEAIAFRAVNARWDYGSGPGVSIPFNFAPDMATAMRRNPAMRLMIGTGFYDLVTPLGTAEYTVDHHGIPRGRTLMREYPSGHMTYIGAVARAMTAGDVRAFLTSPSPGQPQ